jgi:hypothetical protein
LDYFAPEAVLRSTRANVILLNPNQIYDGVQAPGQAEVWHLFCWKEA